MKEFYKSKITYFFLKRGELLTLLHFFWLLLKDALGISRRMIYRASRLKWQPTSSSLPDFVKIIKVSNQNEYNALKESSPDNHTHLWQDTLNHIEKGRDVWLAFLEGRLAHISCTKKGSPCTYFLSLTNKDVVIAHCKTLPGESGRGLYRMTIKQIVDTLLSQGLENIYIDCYEWNWPSSRGIEKAGFKLIGHGWDKKGKLTFKSL